jgi:hypothetical protein
MAEENTSNIINNLVSSVAKEDAYRKSRVAATPLDASKETFMGESVGAKPTTLTEQAATGSMLNLAPRRRQRMAPRAGTDIDPAKLGEFMAQQTAGKEEAGTEPDSALPAKESAVEEPKPALASLMVKTPSPELAKEESKSESPKVPSPKAESPTKEKTPSPEPEAAKSVEEVPTKEVKKEETPSPPKVPSEIEGRLADYDRICTYFVASEQPNARTLVGYLQPLIKEELPMLRERTKRLEEEINNLKDELAKKDSEVSQAMAKAAEAEQKATAVVATATNQAVENAAINDEDVNRLRTAFEEHLQSYQQSMDQFQTFFDKITADLESTFADLGIEDVKQQSATPAVAEIQASAENEAAPAP